MWRFVTVLLNIAQMRLESIGFEMFIVYFGCWSGIPNNTPSVTRCNWVKFNVDHEVHIRRWYWRHTWLHSELPLLPVYTTYCGACWTWESIWREIRPPKWPQADFKSPTWNQNDLTWQKSNRLQTSSRLLTCQKRPNTTGRAKISRYHWK